MLLSSHKRPPCLLALCMSHQYLDCLWHNSRRALSSMASILGGAKAVCSISPVPPRGWIARCTKSMWRHDIVPSWHCVLPRSQSISVQVIWGILWSFACIAASWGARTLECKCHWYEVVAKIHWTSASFIASVDAQSLLMLPWQQMLRSSNSILYPRIGAQWTCTLYMYNWLSPSLISAWESHLISLKVLSVSSSFKLVKQGGSPVPLTAKMISSMTLGRYSNLPWFKGGFTLEAKTVTPFSLAQQDSILTNSRIFCRAMAIP